MRELKFRAWGIGIKEYLGVDVAENIVNILGELIAQGNWEIEQYTGLKDKNGKEIYEGDIIEIPVYLSGGEPRVRGEVVWSYEATGFVCRTIPDDPIGYCIIASTIDGEVIAAETEVLGNIHENPELARKEYGGGEAKKYACPKCGREATEVIGGDSFTAWRCGSCERWFDNNWAPTD